MLSGFGFVLLSNFSLTSLIALFLARMRSIEPIGLKKERKTLTFLM